MDREKRAEGEALFDAIGTAARHVGTAAFHTDLLNVVQLAVAAERRMVVRYFQYEKPEIFGNVNVPQQLIDLYLDKYYQVDPFLLHWKANGGTRVVTLRDTLSSEMAKAAYAAVFTVKARLSDEVGVFLPWIAHSSIALFLERSRGRFARPEVERLRQLYPVLAGLNKAHLSRLFCALIGEKASIGLPGRGAMMVADGRGVRIHATAAWRDAEHELPGLAAAAAALAGSGWRARVGEGWELHLDRLGADSPLAPGGYVFVLEKRWSGAALDERGLTRLFRYDGLTRRESEVVRLILLGYPTVSIGKRLGISPGTVKNHRLKIYAKLDITTERELFLIFFQQIADQLAAPGRRDFLLGDASRPVAATPPAS